MDSADDLRERLRSLPVFTGDLPAFDVDAAPPEPAALFGEWLAAAIDAGVREPHAFSLSTVDADGRPSSRVVILKGLKHGRWQFASSRGGRKARELDTNPWAAAVFYWREQGRQVRLRGRVVDAGPDASARDYLARSPASRAEALHGRQSEPLHDPAELDRALEDARARLDADPDLVATNWVLYELMPDEVEFWQADVDRRHARLAYRLEGDRWSRTRLWP